MTGLVLQSTPTDIDIPTVQLPPAFLQQLDDYMSARAFDDYKIEKSANTLKSQEHDLIHFGSYLSNLQATTGTQADVDGAQLGKALFNSHEAWKPITGSIAKGYKLHMLSDGLSISSINRRLSTMRKYAALAFEAGSIDNAQYDSIRLVSGTSRKGAARVNEKRGQSSKGQKKAKATVLEESQVHCILDGLSDLDTVECRDAALLAALAEHGLRISEMEELTAKNVDLVNGTLSFRRSKQAGTDREFATHKLTPVSTKYLARWFNHINGPTQGTDNPLWPTMDKHRSMLHTKPLKVRTMQDIIKRMGDLCEISNLSPHDLRHYCATRMAAQGYNVAELCSWFGWNSPAMALVYIEAPAVAERYKG